MSPYLLPLGIFALVVILILFLLAKVDSLVGSAIVAIVIIFGLYVFFTMPMCQILDPQRLGMPLDQALAQQGSETVGNFLFQSKAIKQQNGQWQSCAPRYTTMFSTIFSF